MIIEGAKLLIDETENLYYETRIILKSIARIIRIYDTCIDENYSAKGFFVEKNNFEADLEEWINKIVLNEYDNIYYYLNRKIRKNINLNLCVNDMQFNEKISTKSPVTEFDKKYFDYLKLPIQASRKMIENIIKLDNTRHTYILASYKGIYFSHKCSLNEKNNHLSFDYLLLFQDSSFKNLESINLKHNKEIENVMELLMCKKLVYNEIALKLFISLIHLFTKISGQDTKYEIYHNDKGLYEIEWSYGRSFGKKLFKKYYLQKNIPSSSTTKNKITNVAYLENTSAGYSITKAKKIKARTNKIRLLLLNCGHQLGLKLLDYFFEKCYDMEFGRSNCPICGRIITIIGSQDVFYDKLKRIKT
jgi:hypothetical protein